MNALKINLVQFDSYQLVYWAPYIYGPVRKFEIGTPKMVPFLGIFFIGF